MKKIILIIMMSLLVVGCQKEDEEEIKRIEKLINDPSPTETPEPTPSYVDTNPITVGIYKDYKLVHEYNTKFKDQADIAIFNVVFSNEEKLTKKDNFKTTWKNYYNNYEDIDEYKVGFMMEFEANGEKQENIMLNPKNQHKLHPYLYAYLYDDIHNSGSYSHVTMDKMKDNTVFTSIKLFIYKDANKITTPITLTVFTYKDNNDFIDGHYRGNSKYSITINNK